jgi:hypothetical protein
MLGIYEPEEIEASFGPIPEEVLQGWNADEGR